MKHDNFLITYELDAACGSSSKGHETAIEEIKRDIVRLKQESGINA